MKRVKRKKAWIGAAIAAVASIASAAINAANKNKQLREQETEQNKQNAFQSAQNLSQSYADQDYVNEFQDRVTFKSGGSKKHCGSNVVSDAKRGKYCIGGRRKKLAGGNEDIINSIIQGIGQIGSSAITNSVNPNIRQGNVLARNTAKQGLKQPDYMRNSQLRQPITGWMKMGGKCKK